MSDLELYHQVVTLVQDNKPDEARVIAITIQVEHLRTMALLICNDSRWLGNAP